MYKNHKITRKIYKWKTYRQPGAYHREHGLPQKLSIPDQIQEICKHCWPKPRQSEVFHYIIGDNEYIRDQKVTKQNLARHVQFSIIFSWIKWATTSKDSTTLRRQTREQSQGTFSIIKGVMYRIILYLTPCISFSCCTLGLRSRVGECKYKRSLHSRN